MKLPRSRLALALVIPLALVLLGLLGPLALVFPLGFVALSALVVSYWAM